MKNVYLNLYVFDCTPPENKVVSITNLYELHKDKEDRMSEKEPQFDIIMIGAGHNGLCCAAYLARAGMKVKILEQSDHIGGAVITEEIADGFKISPFAYHATQLCPQIVQDLELERYGLEMIEKPYRLMSLLPDGRHLCLSHDDEENTREISKFSPQDAKTHRKFVSELHELAALTKNLFEDRVPDITGSIGDIWRMLKAGHKYRKLSTRQQEKLHTIFTSSIGDYLDSWFDSQELKGMYAALALTGNMIHPYSAGSAFALIRYYLNKRYKGKSIQVKGGIGNITQSMAKSAMAFGVDIECNSTVEKVNMKQFWHHGKEVHQACGVTLEGGQEITARMVVANCDFATLFTKLIDGDRFDDMFSRRVKTWRQGSGSFRVNLALEKAPEITSLAGIENIESLMGAHIIIAPSLDYIEQAYRDARIRGFARNPFLTLDVPTFYDAELAPEGQHIMHVMAHYFNYDLPDELEWEHISDEAVDHILQVIDPIIPSLRDIILHQFSVSPDDIEKRLHMRRGDIYHGAMHLDQYFTMRPAFGYADYRSPVNNLYMCGASNHPGGNVTGLPGRLSAQEMIKDFAHMSDKTNNSDSAGS